jgi:hypothetical protein
MFKVGGRRDWSSGGGEKHCTSPIRGRKLAGLHQIGGFFFSVETGWRLDKKMNTSPLLKLALECLFLCYDCLLLDPSLNFLSKTTPSPPL